MMIVGGLIVGWGLRRHTGNRPSQGDSDLAPGYVNCRGSVFFGRQLKKSRVLEWLSGEFALQSLRV